MGVFRTETTAILALTAGAFAVGTSEFMISGLLQEVATDLGVGIPSAGLLITGYALGVTVGGPLMAIALRRMGRRRQLLLLMAIFVAGNLICALAPSYQMLLGGRVLTSFCHGAFYGLASVVAGVLAPAGRKAQAVAMVSAGVMVANVIGVPAGAALGQMLGWRAAFWVVCGIGGVAAAAMGCCVPAGESGAASKLGTELRAIGKPRVLGGLLLGLLFTVGLFSTFSFVVPLLREVSGADPALVPWLLMLFGAGSTVGVLVGGKLADRRLEPAIAVAFAAQAVVYLAILMTSANLAAMAALLFGLGCAAMLVVAPVRTLVINAAHEAPSLAATVNSSTFNLGAALGSGIGALLIEAGFGYAILPAVGMAAAAAAMLVLRLTAGSGKIPRPEAASGSVARAVS